ncbi:MAG: glycosyltransferase family 2 protein, partial [Deltaproteobacteria bacterium]
MKLQVVILNFRTAAMTLEAVAAADRALARIPAARSDVVDTDSGDGSVEALRAGIARAGQARVQLLASPANGGFGAGNNFA